MKYIALFALYVLYASPIFAQEFSLPIAVSDGSNSSTVIFGVNNNGDINTAVEGLDQPAPPPSPSGSFDARFTLNNIDYFTKFLDTTKVDNKFIQLSYAAATGESAISLSWNHDDLPTDWELNFTNGQGVSLSVSTLNGSYNTTTAPVINNITGERAFDNGLFITLTSTHEGPRAEIPTFSPAAGTYAGPVSIRLTTSTPNATIYYTIDGTDPSENSSAYTTPFGLSKSATVKVITIAEGLNPSNIVEANYIINGRASSPVFTPDQGVYTDSVIVSISASTPNSTIYYTIDGTEPSTNSNIFDEAFTLPSTSTVRAIATAENFLDSQISEALYTIESSNVKLDLEVYMHVSEEFNPTADQVFISGSAFGWPQPGTNADLQLNPDAENELIRTISLEIEPGDYQYKFFLATTEVPNWERGEWPGDPNRNMNISGDTTIKVVFGIQPGQSMSIADGRSLPNGAPMQLEGIITTPDYGFNNGQFFIQDNTAGLAVFWSSFGGGNTETPFNAGDEVRMVGERSTFRNLVQLNPSSYETLSSGNDLPEAVAISPSEWTADSDLQGSRVTLSNVTLVDPSQWPADKITSGSGVNVEVTDGQNTFLLRIDRDESFFDGSAAPTVAFDITGALGAFSDIPQLFPFFEDELTPTSGTSIENLMLPKTFKLEQNYPNPFNPTTSISYTIPETDLVELKVFNMQGQQIASLVNEIQAAGSYQIYFNAANLPSGIYIYRLNANGNVLTRKMILIK